jgi:hypothetical protein
VKIYSPSNVKVDAVTLLYKHFPGLSHFRVPLSINKPAQPSGLPVLQLSYTIISTVGLKVVDTEVVVVLD